MMTEMKPGIVHRSTGIYHLTEKNPQNLLKHLNKQFGVIYNEQGHI